MFYAYIDAEFKEYIDSDIDYADVYTVPYSPENRVIVNSGVQRPESSGGLV
jgi:hypothetical protein